MKTFRAFLSSKHKYQCALCEKGTAETMVMSPAGVIYLCQRCVKRWFPKKSKKWFQGWWKRNSTRRKEGIG